VAETQQTNGIEVLETREWLDSLDYVLSKGGPDRAGRLLQQLALHARREAGINLPFSATTPYQNTIPSRQQPPFPGSQEMERRIKSLVRWNAMAMVVRANKIQEGIGGHISIIFFRHPPSPATATLSIFRDTPPLEFTPARISRAESPKKSWRTSGVK
jgi:pyruvate dehydrogenase complex dehydrogenase (E1) component